MYWSFFKALRLLVLSAFTAALAIARDAFALQKDPSVDGPRSLLAEFFGYWIAGFLLFWSFFEQAGPPRWLLRGGAGIFVLVGISFSMNSEKTQD